MLFTGKVLVLGWCVYKKTMDGVCVFPLHLARFPLESLTVIMGKFLFAYVFSQHSNHPYTLMPLLGEISLFPYDFIPEGWSACDGKLLDVQAHQALYSLILHRYGGNDKQFALPDLRGRAAIGAGQGPGLSHFMLAGHGGSETQKLELSQLPAHTHAFTNGTVAMPISTLEGNTNDPKVGVPASVAIKVDDPSATITATANGYRTDSNEKKLLDLTGAAGGPAGGGQEFSIRDPFLTLQYCICIDGGDYPVKPD